MTITLMSDFGASASAHAVYEVASDFTHHAATFEISVAASGDSASSRRIELLRAIEGEEWLEVERLTPPDDALNRIAERFTPPSEWFNEEDVL